MYEMMDIPAKKFGLGRWLAVGAIAGGVYTANSEDIATSCPAQYQTVSTTQVVGLAAVANSIKDRINSQAPVLNCAFIAQKAIGTVVADAGRQGVSATISAMTGYR